MNERESPAEQLGWGKFARLCPVVTCKDTKTPQIMDQLSLNYGSKNMEFSLTRDLSFALSLLGIESGESQQAFIMDFRSIGESIKLDQEPESENISLEGSKILIKYGFATEDQQIEALTVIGVALKKNKIDKLFEERHPLLPWAIIVGAGMIVGGGGLYYVWKTKMQR